MKKSILILMAAIAGASASAAPPQLKRYDVQVRFFEGGELIASPRLIVEEGKLATFVSDDGAKGWSLKVTATPDEGNGAVALASDLETWSGRESRRRATTTVRIQEGHPAAFELSPRESLPSVRVEFSVDSL